MWTDDYYSTPMGDVLLKRKFNYRLYGISQYRNDIRLRNPTLWIYQSLKKVGVSE